jgi:hypothetical protein
MHTSPAKQVSPGRSDTPKLMLAMSESNPKHALRRLNQQLRDLRARHAERHRPTGLGFAFADRVDYLDPQRWDAVTAEAGFFLRRDVLRVIEDHGPENIQPRYVMIFHGAEPIAAIAAQVVTITGERLRRERAVSKANPKGGVLRQLIAPVVRAAGDGLCERMLVAGNLLSWGFHGIAFAPNCDVGEVWPGVAEALYRLRRAERLTGGADFTMVKDITSGQAAVEALRRFSYRAFETEPNMVLHLDPAWRTHDDYLAALDSKYRKKVKDQAKKLAAAGCTIESLDASGVAAEAARLHELYLAVQANASVRLVTIRPSYFPALARAAGDDFRCTVIRRGSEIIGFVTSVRDGEAAVGYYIGFNRAAAAEGIPIYLQLLHATISDAIGWRSRRLSLGRTALEPKAGRGAKPEPMTVWLRHRVPAMNWILRALLDAVPHAEPPERNPFKSADTGSAGAPLG